MASNDYWNGTKHAVLKKEDVTAKWINGTYGASRGLGATNKAYCIWYHGRQTLTTLSDPSAMKKSLEECGYTGWGVGVNDLNEAFQHLTSNNGKWTDNTSSSFGSYSGKAGDYTGSGKGIYVSSDDIHPSTSEFLTAVDKALTNMKDAMVTYKSKCQALQSIKVKPTSPKTDWDKVKTNVDGLKKAAENVSRYAWLAPATIQAALPSSYLSLSTMNKASDFTDALTNRMDQSVKFLDVVGKIHDSMTLYVQATKAFDGDQRVGVAFGALSFALTYVPVLGGFYGEIIKRIPGLVENWKAFMDTYVSRIDNYEAYMKMKALEEANKWKCNICGSM